jgi:hypothetical protein
MKNDFDPEQANRVLDAYLLSFLDDYEYEFGKLPSKEEQSIWTRGFIDGCLALTQSLVFKGPDQQETQYE